VWSWLRRIFGRREVTLQVARLADMILVHPQMDSSRVCLRCGEPVGIYPSGQAFIKMYPRAHIICTICQPPSERMILVPGALEESSQSIRRQP